MNHLTANTNQIIMMIIVGSVSKKIDLFCVAIHVTDHFIWLVSESKKCHTVNGIVHNVANVKIPHVHTVRKKVQMKN